MAFWNNLRTFINVGFLAATDTTVEKVFGDYESAAQAQADVNRLSAIMDSEIVGKRFSKRKAKEQLFLEDLLGEESKPAEPKHEPMDLIAWWNSLSDEEKKTVRDIVKE